MSNIKTRIGAHIGYRLLLLAAMKPLDEKAETVKSARTNELEQIAALLIGEEPPADQESVRRAVAKLLVNRCTNCFRELLSGESQWPDPNVGPFCKSCYSLLAASPRAGAPTHSRAVQDVQESMKVFVDNNYGHAARDYVNEFYRMLRRATAKNRTGASHRRERTSMSDAETPLARLRKFVEHHANCARWAQITRVDGGLTGSRYYDGNAACTCGLSALVTDLEAAPPHEKHEEVVTRVATGETMPATGSTAKTANGLSGTRFRKKPVVVEARQYAGNGNMEPRGGLPEWLWDALGNGTAYFTKGGLDPLYLKTLEGPLTVSPGDWIICGVKGELYPCKPDIFAATYEPVEGEAAASRPAEPLRIVARLELALKAGAPNSDLLRCALDEIRKLSAVSPAVEGGREGDRIRTLEDALRPFAELVHEDGVEAPYPLTTDRQDVIDCMGSTPVCSRWGCQLRKVAPPSFCNQTDLPNLPAIEPASPDIVFLPAELVLRHNREEGILTIGESLVDASHVKIWNGNSMQFDVFEIVGAGTPTHFGWQVKNAHPRWNLSACTPKK
jgi:hypothetical protein